MKISKAELLDFVKKSTVEIFQLTSGNTKEALHTSAVTFQITLSLLAEHQGIRNFEEDFIKVLNNLSDHAEELFGEVEPPKDEPVQVVGYETSDGDIFCLACSDDEVLGSPGVVPVLLSGAQGWGHICIFCGKRLDGRVTKEGR